MYYIKNHINLVFKYTQFSMAWACNLSEKFTRLAIKGTKTVTMDYTSQAF